MEGKTLHLNKGVQGKKGNEGLLNPVEKKERKIAGKGGDIGG